MLEIVPQPIFTFKLKILALLDNNLLHFHTWHNLLGISKLFSFLLLQNLKNVHCFFCFWVFIIERIFDILRLLFASFKWVCFPSKKCFKAEGDRSTIGASARRIGPSCFELCKSVRRDRVGRSTKLRGESTSSLEWELRLERLDPKICSCEKGPSLLLLAAFHHCNKSSIIFY